MPDKKTASPRKPPKETAGPPEFDAVLKQMLSTPPNPNAKPKPKTKKAPKG
jgi:hypothetical protein